MTSSLSLDMNALATGMGDSLDGGEASSLMLPLPLDSILVRHPASHTSKPPSCSEAAEKEEKEDTFLPSGRPSVTNPEERDKLGSSLTGSDGGSISDDKVSDTSSLSDIPTAVHLDMLTTASVTETTIVGTLEPRMMKTSGYGLTKSSDNLVTNAKTSIYTAFEREFGRKRLPLENRGEDEATIITIRETSGLLTGHCEIKSDSELYAPRGGSGVEVDRSNEETINDGSNSSRPTKSELSGEYDIARLIDSGEEVILLLTLKLRKRDTGHLFPPVFIFINT
ncbi:unnamed protein product [Protopolystoma xenopodis]|uniref:Uncharacterized protein n=1 Tax=Protopolystoma xenopodis TaxID=117903 RepID=A0A448WUS3_9PLAT|nr:unnamed protein product [Protopolystoma xenopodis]